MTPEEKIEFVKKEISEKVKISPVKRISVRRVKKERNIVRSWLSCLRLNLTSGLRELSVNIQVQKPNIKGQD